MSSPAKDAVRIVFEVPSTTRRPARTPCFRLSWQTWTALAVGFNWASVDVTTAFKVSVVPLQSGVIPALPRDYCQLETFHADCAPAEVIVVQAALYGRMRIGRCVRRDYGHMGCTTDVLAVVDGMCSGRLHTCSFPVSSLHRFQPCPGDLTPYLEAAFVCVSVNFGPASKVACSSQAPITIISNAGYISSSVTMETGRGSPDCPWRIHMPFGRRINITLVHFFPRTQPSPVGSLNETKRRLCFQLAVIREDRIVRSITECDGGQRESHAYTSLGSVVLVELLSTKTKPMFFLLRFEGIGCRNPHLPPDMWLWRDGNEAIVRCNLTGDVWKLHCSATSGWIGEVGNCSAASLRLQTSAGWSVLHTMVTGKSSFPLSVLAVVAVGVSLGVVVGGLLLVCIATYSRRLCMSLKRANPRTCDGRSQPPESCYGEEMCFTEDRRSARSSIQSFACLGAVAEPTSDNVGAMSFQVLTSHGVVPVSEAWLRSNLHNHFHDIHSETYSVNCPHSSLHPAVPGGAEPISGSPAPGGLGGNLPVNLVPRKVHHLYDRPYSDCNCLLTL